MKDVQCYELFGGIALKNHEFSFSKWNNVYVSNDIDEDLDNFMSVLCGLCI